MSGVKSRSDGLCPVNPDHGKLILLNGRLYCGHVEHVGRPKTHPLGPSEPTPCFFGA